MKFPLLRGNTTKQLEQLTGELHTIQSEIAALQAQYDALPVEAPASDSIEFTDSIAELHRVETVQIDRIAKLARRLADEQAAAAARKRADDIDNLSSQLLPPIVDAYLQLQNAVKTVVNAMEKIDKAHSVAELNWPSSLEDIRPYYIDAGRAVRVVRAAFQSFAPDFRYPAERLSHTREAVADLVQQEKQLHNELIDHLRFSSPTAPVETPAAEAPPAEGVEVGAHL